MNRSRRRNNRKRSNRKRRGGSMVPLSPAPIHYRTVSANPQPSERVMQWATTAGAATPSAGEMQGVAHGGRRTRRRRSTRHKHSRRCRHKRSRRH